MPRHAYKVAQLVRDNKKALMRHLGVLDGTIDAVVDEDEDSCSMTVNVPASVDVELAMILKLPRNGDTEAKSFYQVFYQVLRGTHDDPEERLRFLWFVIVTGNYIF